MNRCGFASSIPIPICLQHRIVDSLNLYANFSTPLINAKRLTPCQADNCIQIKRSILVFEPNGAPLLVVHTESHANFCFFILASLSF